jgi:hypothetical protein
MRQELLMAPAEASESGTSITQVLAWPTRRANIHKTLDMLLIWRSGPDDDQADVHNKSPTAESGTTRFPAAGAHQTTANQRATSATAHQIVLCQPVASTQPGT